MPRLLVKSAGGALTQNAGPRELAEFYTQSGLDAYDQEPDVAGLQDFAKRRSVEGGSALINALAAGYAGERFAPVQSLYLKKASAAQEPLKVGTGYVTPEGEYVKDPSASRDRRAETFLRLGQQYASLADRQEGRDQTADLRRDLAAIAAGSGGLGAGAAPQIGSAADGAPVFRSSREGTLFTYDPNGQPVAYAGPVLPRVSTAQPTEDERKAAGWYAQAFNARRNMEKVIGVDASASTPTLKESALEKVPFWGSELANNARPENRQMFVQAASSMAEALLRAATGAGINESEAKQKVNELVPVLGDKQGVIKQKLNSYDVYMASLRARASRALPQLESALQEIYGREELPQAEAGAPSGFGAPPPGAVRRKP